MAVQEGQWEEGGTTTTLAISDKVEQRGESFFPLPSSEAVVGRKEEEEGTKFPEEGAFDPC